MKNKPYRSTALCFFTLMTLPASALTPIESWRQQNFQSTDNAGSAADTADPDGGGIVNLLEYGLCHDVQIEWAAAIFHSLCQSPNRAPRTGGTTGMSQ
jgi:hypothetical protein